MLSAILAAHTRQRANAFPLLDLPPEMVEKIVTCLGPSEQRAKKATRAACHQLRSAVNFGVTSVKVSSNMEGQTLPATLLPQLKTITLDMSSGSNKGLWTVESLQLLGIEGAGAGCRIEVQADAAMVHLSQLRRILEESGLLPRVVSLNHSSWGIRGNPAHFGPAVEVSARLKLVRQECVESLIHHTLAHDNLTALCFAPMLKTAWNANLVQEINASSGATLRSFAINFRPFQEVTMEPAAGLKLPQLTHLELKVQNSEGFGSKYLQPLASAVMPKLRSLVVEMTGTSSIPHLGEFIRPLAGFTELETIEIWANKIDSFAGLWGVGNGGIHLSKLNSLSLRVSPCSLQMPKAVFAANPVDKVVDAFAGLTLDKLALHDIGLPEGAAAKGIKRLELKNPRWEDLHVAMAPQFCPDLKVIRVCGSSARAMRAKMQSNMLETPALEPGWRMGSPVQGNNMHKVRSFVVLHDTGDNKATCH